MAAAALFTALALSAPAPVNPTWTALGKGVDYATLPLESAPAHGDGLLHVVRISPDKSKLRILTKSETEGKSRTAQQWCEKEGLLVVTNAGMFETDHSTHTGYLRVNQHVNNASWWKNYQSLLLIGPKKPGTPQAQIQDLQPSNDRGDHADYAIASQNLRLIRGPGRSVWRENGKAWSEAALAEDKQGRILFVFSRTPYSMATLNQKLLALPLGIVRALHLEGGPEASLSVCSKKLKLHLSGSYETGFNENDDNREQWVLPNVIGVVAEP